jgi:hypothetical protein
VPAKKKRKSRKGKEERKRKTDVIKFSSCGSFQELPPYAKSEKSS